MRALAQQYLKRLTLLRWLFGLEYIFKTRSNYSFYYWIFLFLFWFDKNIMFQLAPKTCPNRIQARWVMQAFPLSNYLCIQLKRKISIFSQILKRRPEICIHNFKDRWLSKTSPAKHLVFFFWLTIDWNLKVLKLLHIEIVSLWIKTIVNFRILLKPYLR